MTTQLHDENSALTLFRTYLCEQIEGGEGTYARYTYPPIDPILKGRKKFCEERGLHTVICKKSFKIN